MKSFCLLISLLSMLGVSAQSAFAQDRPFLGLQIQGIDERITGALGKEDLQGVMIRDIAFPGPSSQAGMLRGDIITKVNGQKATSVDQLVKISSDFKPGDQVDMTVLRGTSEVKLKVTVNPMPQSWAISRNSFSSIPALGVTFASLTQKVRDRFNLGWAKRGVVISLLDEEKSKGLDLRVGDVIVQVNQRDVWKPSHIVSSVKKAQTDGREVVLLLIHGDDGFRYTLIPVPK